MRVTPDPVAGPWQARFVLPESGPVSLALLDVAGRMVTSRTIVGLERGEHVVPMGVSSTFAPGVYFLRIRQAEQAGVRRVCIIE